MTEILVPGTIARYRKVGKVEIIAHACDEIGYDCSQYHGAGGQHRYQARFITGPKAYKVKGDSHRLWIRTAEAIAKRIKVWESPSGLLHWLQGCSAGGGRHRVRRTSITATAWDPEKHCRCLRHKLTTKGL